MAATRVLGERVKDMDLSKRDSAIKFGCGRYRQSRALLPQLGEEIRRFGTKAFIIAGRRSWAAVEAKLTESLAAAGVMWRTELWAGACSSAGAHELAERAREFGADEIVGIGGGKNMDLAKAVGEVSGLGVVLIPTSVAQCAPCACTSVMYTPDGKKDVTWRYEHEIDGCYADLDVIASCPPRYMAAGILDAMAKKIEILNGRPDLNLDTTEIDLFTAYSLARYTYEVLEASADAAIEANRRGEVTKALEEVVFMNLPVTGIVSNMTRGYNQTQLAHVFYDCVRTLFTRESAGVVHGEIVAVGLFLQLYFNGLRAEEERLRGLLERWDMPRSLSDLGIEATEENLDAIEEYIVSSRHYNSDDPADRRRLHEAIGEMI